MLIVDIHGEIFENLINAMTASLIHPLLSRTMIYQFLFAQCQDCPVLNEEYSNILSTYIVFIFFISSVLALNVEDLP